MLHKPRSQPSHRQCQGHTRSWMVTMVTIMAAILCVASIRPCMAQVIQVDENPEDIKKYLTILEDSDHNKEEIVAKQPVSVMWGIADTTATLGKLFQYTLPKEAFRGEVTRYKVGKTKLLL